MPNTTDQEAAAIDALQKLGAPHPAHMIYSLRSELDRMTSENQKNIDRVTQLETHQQTERFPIGVAVPVLGFLLVQTISSIPWGDPVATNKMGFAANIGLLTVLFLLVGAIITAIIAGMTKWDPPEAK